MSTQSINDSLKNTTLIDINNLSIFWDKAKSYIQQSLDDKNVGVTNISAGIGLKAGSNDTITSTGTIDLKTATTTEIGGIKVGTANSSAITKATEGTKYYPVNVDSTGLGYVALPSFTTNNGDITGVTAGNGLTGGATSGTATLNVGAGIGISVDTDSVNIKSATASELGGIAVGYEANGRNYPVTLDTNNNAYVNVPWSDTNTTKFTITANFSDDDVVVLSGTNGTNSVTYSASHAKKFSTSGDTYTSGNSTTTISGYGDSKVIKIPQISVDEYGHVISASDENVTITMPSQQDLSGYKTKQTAVTDPTASTTTSTTFIDTISQDTNGKITATKKTIPSLSGGSASASDKTVISGVTVNGHAITATKKTIAGAGTVSVTDNGSTITITGSSHPTSLKNPNSLTLQIGGTTKVTYDGSSAKTFDVTASDLGLAAALKYHGITTTALTDGATTSPIVINNANHTPETGCVVFYGDKEFAWDGSKWEELGFSIDLSGYKTKQTAVNSPSASTTTSTTFIDTISQDTNGKITATKKTLKLPSWSGSTISAGGHSHTFSSGSAASAGGHSHTIEKDSTNVSTVSTSAHTHSIPKTSTTGVTVASSSHTHKLTASGSVSSTFAGDSVATGTPSSNTTSVASGAHTHSVSAATDNSTNKVTVPTTSHTHSVTIGDATGTVTIGSKTSGSASTSSGHTASVASNTHTHSVTGTVASGGASHNHSFTPSGTVTLSGTANAGTLTITASFSGTGSNTGNTTASHSHTFSNGSASQTSTTAVTVSTSSHTHSTSIGNPSFTASFGTKTTGAADSENVTNVATIGHTHTASATGTSSRVSVPNTSHTHNVTATGTVTSEFTGSESTTSSISGTSTVASNSHTHTASANTTNVVTVSTGEHTHACTAVDGHTHTVSGTISTVDGHTHTVSGTNSF